MSGISKEELTFRQSEELQELRRQIAEKERILESYKKDHGQLEVFFNSLINHVTPIDPLPCVYKPAKEKKGSEVVAVMQISDGHMGAVQLPDEIEGFGEFNPELCRSRQLDFVGRVNKWVDRHRMAYTINKITVLVTGDLISGDIHQELQVTNAFPITVQCVEAAKVLTEQMVHLSQNFDEVTVHFISADNHGRLTKKPQSKQEGLNSMNYIVGKLTEAYLKGIPNVLFNIYPMHEKIVRVLNRNYLLSHGHGVQGWMGKPWYGIERKIGKEAEARMDLIMNEKMKMHEIGFHKYVFGHFHVPFDTVNYSCAGSVQGTDAYDHKNGRYAEPSQPAWLVHQKHAEFGRVDFRLGG